MKAVRLLLAAATIALAAACSNSPTAPSATEITPSFGGFAGSGG